MSVPTPFEAHDGMHPPWTCPVHGEKVQVIPRRSIAKSERDDSGTQGAFYGCPKYSECGYYIGSNLKRAYRSRVIAASNGEV